MKRIIILEIAPGSAQGYKYALWAAVPSARQAFYANASKKSAWKDIAPAELTALQNGSVFEKVEQLNNATVQTLAQLKTQLETRWTAFQAEITALNLWDRYGSFYDDTNSWTNGGVS